jgi:hypothetical protein
LTDTLAKTLPEYPDKERAQKITVHHLLSHMSGLDEGPYDKMSATSRQRFRTVKEYLPKTPNDQLKFEPSAKLDYSKSRICRRYSSIRTPNAIAFKMREWLIQGTHKQNRCQFFGIGY